MSVRLGRLCRVLLTVAVSVTGLGATVVAAPPAVAAGGTASISGQLTPVAGTFQGSPIQVIAYPVGTPGGGYDMQATPDSQGNWTIPYLDAGAYKVKFLGGSDHLAEWYNNAASNSAATQIVLADGQQLTGINASLEQEALISGTVTNKDGDPVEGVTVRIWQSPSLGAFTPLTSRLTDAEGHYEVDYLYPGEYFVEYDASGVGYFTEFYENGKALNEADSIVVDYGDNFIADAVLVEPASISGNIADASGPLEGICAGVYRYNEDFAFYMYTGSACSDVNGDYVVNDLVAGVYKLQFNGGDAHVSEWFNDKTSQAAADEIVVLEGDDVSGMDANLARSGTIDGTVSRAEGVVEGVHVTAYRMVAGDWMAVASDDTGVTGQYEIDHLPPATYRLHIDGRDVDYSQEYWDNQPSLGAADNIAVGDGATVTKDATLDRLGSVSGTVTGPGGFVLDEVCVRAFHAVGGGAWDWDRGDCTTDGQYTVSGLEPDNYRLEFVDSSGDHLTEWFNDEPTLTAAEDVVVGLSIDVTGRDAELALGATISGTVTGPAATPLEEVDVQVYRLDGADYEYYRSTETESDGTFDLNGLPTGSYKVEYGLFGYADEFWNSMDTLADADPIPAQAGTTYSGRNAQMENASSISGTVTGPGGGAAAETSVATYVLRDGDWDYDDTYGVDVDGTYLIEDLQQGTYTLQFRGANYVTEWWNDKPTRATADTIVLPRASAATGKNAALSAAGHITGTVTKTGGGPIVYGYIEAYRLVAGSWEYVADTETEATGAYDIDGLRSGEYKVHFFDDDGFTGEWWNNKSSLETADTVTVNAGAVTAEIDAELSVGGHVTGRVTNTAATGLDDISVYAYQVDGADLDQVGSADTGTDGTFDIDGLPAGDYKLEYVDEGSGSAYAAEWWNDALTPGTATAFTLEAGGTVTGKNAQLIVGSHITGKVTGSTGTALQGVEVTTFRLVDGTYKQQNYGSTDSSGNYDLTGLPQGSYKVEFDDGPGGQPTEYWNHVSTLAAATTIPVGPSTTVGSINGQPGGTVPPPVITAGTPSITGTPQVGSVLVANPGTWTPSDVDLAFQWLANDAVVAGQNGSTLVLTSAQQGATIKVRVTGSKSGYSSATVTSSGVGPVAAAPTPPTPAVSNTAAPTVSGAAKVGATLSASGGSWSPGDVSLAYQWLANGAPIAGATGTTYAVPAGDVGKQLSVRVTASKTGSTAATATSASTGAVAKGTLSVVKKPKLSGQAKVSKTLTVKAGTFAPAGAKVKYQWLVNGKKIGGAKGTSLAIKAAFKGKTISVKVTVTLAGYETLVLETKGKKAT